MNRLRRIAVGEVPVDALRVVATPVQDFEVRIARWDLTDVLGPVELAFRVLRVGMQPHCYDSPAQLLGRAVVVAPAERPALVDIAMVRTRSSGANTGFPDSVARAIRTCATPGVLRVSIQP